MKKVIGIDLGTTNSVVAVVEGGHPIVIANQEGSRTTPSVVGFSKSGERLIGQIARRQIVTNPQSTIYSIKRLMGRRFDEVNTMRGPYKVVRGTNGDVRVEVNGTKHSPAEIAALILAKLKEAAEAYLGMSVTDAVITVPAYFNDAQRQATKDAGQIAGLTVLRIINEPTAAALAYGLDKNQDQVVAIYDFGGGTFDISILAIQSGVIEVKATNGDTELGGDDIDYRLTEWIIDNFRRDEGVDLSQDVMTVQRIREEVEKAKIELSTSFETEINLPFVSVDGSNPKHLNLKLTRALFEELVEPIFRRSVGPCRQALADAGISASQIDSVLLVGGTTRIPRIQDLVRTLFLREPHKTVNPDEVVAMGAAVRGAMFIGDIKELLLLDVTPLSLGIETSGGVFTRLLPRNTTIPARTSQRFSTASDSQSAVDIKVFQGEREMACDNRALGVFELGDISPAPRGVPQIEVTFEIDANGILNVAARDCSTGTERQVTITSSSGLSESEVRKMAEDAQQFKVQDRRRREQASEANRAETLIFRLERALKEQSGPLSDVVFQQARAAISFGKQALVSNEIVQLSAAVRSMQNIAIKLDEMSAANSRPKGRAWNESDDY